MRAYCLDHVAVIVQAVRLSGECGARVEVRMMEQQAHRGTQEAAQRVVIDKPVWRADLFDQKQGPPGNLAAAHFHPRFSGPSRIEAGERVLDSRLEADALGWLTEQLGDLGALLDAAGLQLAGARSPWVDRETGRCRELIPEIVAAVQSSWTESWADEAP